MGSLELRPRAGSGCWDRPSARVYAGKNRFADVSGPAGQAGAELDLAGRGYAFGIVRVGEEKVTGRRVVQLTSLGRYVLALGSPPPPRPAFEHFLFVQPNLEMIAYRQGLTAPLVGRLSRFAWWTKIGAASS